ncbi:MAG: DUF1028 domain-containing protein [Octadecabacter sp.]|nr:DUF1028 domain-containing protein [Octadecabacter sp.]
MLDRAVGTAGFTGAQSVPSFGFISARNLILAGNLIQSRAVLEALVRGVTRATGTPPERLISALEAAQAAAMLVLPPDAPSVAPRIENSATPLDHLANLAPCLRTAQCRVVEGGPCAQ